VKSLCLLLSKIFEIAKSDVLEGRRESYLERKVPRPKESQSNLCFAQLSSRVPQTPLQGSQQQRQRHVDLDIQTFIIAPSVREKKLFTFMDPWLLILDERFTIRDVDNYRASMMDYAIEVSVFQDATLR
jgi:hypothetical protein